MRRKKGPSRLEEKFKTLWLAIQGPELTRELKFVPNRKFRADFCHVPTKTLIEIEGGVFVRGRHNRPSGFIKDCEKYNLATFFGYSIFRLTPPQITISNLEEIADFIRNKTKS